MNGHSFSFAGAQLVALPSGALFWPDQDILCVSDLHLGKSERMARRGGPILPPYEAQETLSRLDNDIRLTAPKCVICLGDSFDDPEAMRALEPTAKTALVTLMAGRQWIWIEGNHDPGPVDLGGTHVGQHMAEALTFRHIATDPKAQDDHGDGRGEVSGHYHPKARIALRGRNLTRPCFLLDASRLILPAYGTYTGGLLCHKPPLSDLMAADAQAILQTDPPLAIPMPR